MAFTVAVLAGDGIGPEIVAEGVKVLDAVGRRFGHAFAFREAPIGGAAIDACGVCLPESTVDVAQGADGILLGAVGGPDWDEEPASNRPEQALLGIRRALGLFANIRPARLVPALADACPLKPERLRDGIDLVVVRELTGDVYFGERRRDADGRAHDDMTYSPEEVERIARIAFDMASRRRGHVTSVDKANVLETSRLWRETVARTAEGYPDVELDFMYVDNAAMQLVLDPGRFDVILTGNLFGDILSDEASCITGSIGMLPSASLSLSSRGMYEPIHGSAPDIAGRGVANPLATILSVAMMLRYSLDLPEEASAVESAVDAALAHGLRTLDIARPGEEAVSTSAMGDAVAAELLGVG